MSDSAELLAKFRAVNLDLSDQLCRKTKHCGVYYTALYLFTALGFLLCGYLTMTAPDTVVAYGLCLWITLVILAVQAAVTWTVRDKALMESMFSGVEPAQRLVDTYKEADLPVWRLVFIKLDLFCKMIHALGYVGLMLSSAVLVSVYVEAAPVDVSFLGESYNSVGLLFYALALVACGGMRYAKRKITDQADRMSYVGVLLVGLTYLVHDGTRLSTSFLSVSAWILVSVMCVYALIRILFSPGNGLASAAPYVPAELADAWEAYGQVEADVKEDYYATCIPPDAPVRLTPNMYSYLLKFRKMRAQSLTEETEGAEEEPEEENSSEPVVKHLTAKELRQAVCDAAAAQILYQLLDAYEACGLSYFEFDAWLEKVSNAVAVAKELRKSHEG